MQKRHSSPRFMFYGTIPYHNIVYLDLTVLRILLPNRRTRSEGVKGISCFAKLTAVDGIFLEHKIESIAGNVIVFDMDLVLFRTALAATLQSSGGGGEKSAPLHDSGDDASVRRWNPIRSFVRLRDEIGQEQRNALFVSLCFLCQWVFGCASRCPCSFITGRRMAVSS